MSEKGYYIRFIIKTGLEKNKTNYGENIYIVGSEKELGHWDVQKSVELTTNEKSYPKWESEFIHFDENSKNLEYKYIKRKKDSNEMQWENFGCEKNRNLNFTNLDIGYYIVEDGEFSDPSNQRIMTMDDFYNITFL